MSEFNTGKTDNRSNESDCDDPTQNEQTMLNFRSAVRAFDGEAVHKK